LSEVDDNYKKELILRHVADLAHYFVAQGAILVPRTLPLDVESAVSAGIVSAEEIGDYFKEEILKLL
jgi:hypothetical protein